MNRILAIPLTVQLETLKRTFPLSTCHMKTHHNFIWKVQLQPSSLSELYDVKIDYKLGSNPDVYITHPNPLRLAKDAEELPHVYSQGKQHLCLYHRRMNEWNAGKLIVKTIVPWASEWLLHYEIWVATSEWHGEGIH